MPYRASDRLENMIDPDACSTTSREIADDGLDSFQAAVRRNTPVDTSLYRDRPDRPRGALRASIERSPVRHVVTPAGLSYVGEVRTFDPVADKVEWDTPAHEILPRTPGGTLSWRDRWTGERRFAKRVWHPGTQGAHMFAIGAAITQHELDAIARPALERWRHAVTRGHARVTDRRSR